MNINQLIKFVVSKRHLLSRNYGRKFNKNTIDGKMISNENSYLNENISYGMVLPKNTISVSKIKSGEEEDPSNFVGVNPSDAFEDYEVEKYRKKAAIIKKKLLKSSKPFMTILTQRAKEQLFYLFNDKSMSIQKLVENFPLTYVYCEYLVKNPLSGLSLNDLIKDNEIIIDRLIMIKSLIKKNKLDKYQEFNWIVEEDKQSLIQYANGNNNLEFPTKSMLEFKEEYEANRIKGEMESLFNLTSLVEKNTYLPVCKNSKSVLEQQEEKIKRIISFFRPETEIIEDKIVSLKDIERPPLRLPNKASVDYSHLFKYKLSG